MVIFNSYNKLPEGNWRELKKMTSCDLDDLDQVFDASSDGYTKGEGSRLTAYLFST